MKRRTARERAMQALYQMDITGELEPKVAVENTLDEGEETNEFLESLVVGFVENKEAIDEAIRQNLKGKVGMNISGILERVFNKIPKEHVANIITLKRPGWEPEKKL